MEFSWTPEGSGSSLTRNGSPSQGKTRQRELEQRRARGEASCAECRRLRVKCDRKVPCSSCVRRGCELICPNGLLSNGLGSRLVLADTEALHNKLLAMSQRIRQLEDALQVFQSAISNKPHPLLAEHLMSIKSGVDVLMQNTDRTDEEADNDEAITTAMGTLAITECGATRYVGRVGTETLLLGTDIDDSSDQFDTTSRMGPGEGDELDLPEPLMRASQCFPLSSSKMPGSQLTELIKQYLPSYQRATALSEAYLGNATWFPCPMRREHIMEDVLPFVYDRKHNKSPVAPANGKDRRGGMQCLHYLSLALGIFACGAAADYTQAMYNRESRLYYTLALAALNTYPILGQGGVTLETVQAIFLIGIYDFITARNGTIEPATKILAFAMTNAASIGLHRDSAHWEMNPLYVNRRRQAFWELFAFDKWMSLGTGRPPHFHMQEIDCEYPEDDGAYVDDEGMLQEGADRWRYRFAKEILAPLAELLVLTRPVKYSEILEHDRKIREFGDKRLPLEQWTGMDANAVVWTTQRDMALLSIHRNFFARSLAKRSVHPLLNPFAPSYLAGYVCSVKYLRKFRESFSLNPACVLRVWPSWTHSLTAGVIVGSFALRTDQASWARGAFHELESTIKVFQEASAQHPIAKQGLAILLRLRAKAEVSLQSLTRGIIPKANHEEFDELEMLRNSDSARLIRRATSKRNTQAQAQVRDDTDRVSNKPVTATRDPATRADGRDDTYTYQNIDARLTLEPITAHPTMSAVPCLSYAIGRDVASILTTVYDESLDRDGSQGLPVVVQVQVPSSQGFTTADPYSPGWSFATPHAASSSYAQAQNYSPSPEQFTSDPPSSSSSSSVAPTTSFVTAPQAGPPPHPQAQAQYYSPERLSPDSSSSAATSESTPGSVQYHYAMDIEQDYPHNDPWTSDPARESHNDMTMSVDDVTSLAHIEDFFRQYNHSDAA